MNTPACQVETLTVENYNALARQWVLQHNSSGYWASELRRFNQLLPKGRLIEIGAGGARDAKELVALGYEYIGIDVSPTMVEIARDQMPSSEFYIRSVYDMPGLHRGMFAGFWASASLLHIPKIRISEALDALGSVLRDGAIGFISLKEGTDERVETEVVDGKQLTRFFAYWGRDEFTVALNRSRYEVVDYMYHPRSERTRWHCFFVKKIGGA